MPPPQCGSSLCEFDHSGEHVNSGGFTGTVVIKERGDLITVHAEGEDVDGDLVVKLFGEIMQF